MKNAFMGLSVDGTLLRKESVNMMTDQQKLLKMKYKVENEF